MWQQVEVGLLRVPWAHVALGLFCGRVLSEQWPKVMGTGLHWMAAVVLTALTTSLSFLLLHKYSLRQSWPLLFLLGYVFYREPDPQFALLATALTLVAGLQAASHQWQVIRGARLVVPLTLLVALSFLAFYRLTIAPDVLPADNGEFQLVATQLGVAHPPGFPLYVMLAHLMTQLPWANSPAFEVNLFSVIISAATLAVVHLCLYRLTKSHLAGITAALALGTSTTFWAQATTANIRSLTALFTALMIYILLTLWQKQNARTGNQNSTTPVSDRYLLLFALVLSLGITHHASLLFMGTVFVLLVLWMDRELIAMPSRWFRPLLAASVGLLPLLYLPWRARADVPGAELELATLDGFLNHALALGFRGDFFEFIEPVVLWQRFKIMGNVMTFQFSIWLLLGMGIGLLFMLWRDRWLALLCGGSFAVHTFVTATYRAPQTVEYMLPAYVPAAICLGYGVGKMDELFRKRERWMMTAVAQAFAAIMLVSALSQGFQHYPSYDYLHRDTTARDYVQPLLDQAPANSVFLADWHWATPLWYLQEVEGQRPDVAVHYVAPGGEPYAETWAKRIAEEYAQGRTVIATHFNENAYANLPIPEPIGEAFLFRHKARTTLPNGYEPLDLQLGGTLRILGHRLHRPSVEIGQETRFTVAWQPTAALQSPISLFAHVVGADGQLYAQEDLAVEPKPEGITLTQFHLTPRLGAAPGDVTLMIGAYGVDPLLDRDGNPRTAVATLTVTPMRWPPFTQNPVYRPLPEDNERQRLIGYDWDNTLSDQRRLYLHWQTDQGYYSEVQDQGTIASLNLPPHWGPWGIERESQLEMGGGEDSYYVPLGQGIFWTGQTLANQGSLVSNQTVSLPQHFVSNQPLTRDLVVSVRLIGYEADGFNWAWWDLNDSIPAMGAIPTLKWIEGSHVRDPHTLTVDPAARPGQTIGATLRLYDAFSNRPLPILDERITSERQLPWVPLGRTSIGEGAK